MFASSTFANSARFTINCYAVVLLCINHGSPSPAVYGSARMAMAAVHWHSGTHDACICTFTLVDCIRNSNAFILWNGSTHSPVCRTANLTASKRHYKSFGIGAGFHWTPTFKYRLTAISPSPRGHSRSRDSVAFHEAAPKLWTCALAAPYSNCAPTFV